MRAVPPSASAPKSIASDSGFFTLRSMSRAIGRAPNARSKPAAASHARASGSSSIVTPLAATIARSSSICLSTTRSISAGTERIEMHDRVEPVAELRGEHLFQRAARRDALAARLAESEAAIGEIACAGVGRHDQDDVTEVRLAAVRVGQRRVIHHLQQDADHVRVRLLDLVEQQHRVRRLADRVDQQAPLFEADVPGRRANQSRDGVLLHVLGHVVADEVDAQNARELSRKLGLADAGRPREQEVADRLVGRPQSRSRQLDRGRDFVNRAFLSEDDQLQLLVERRERRTIVARHRLHGDTRHPRDDLFDLRGPNRGDTLIRRQQLLRRTCFVQDVDRLVRQVQILQMLRRERHGRSDALRPCSARRDALRSAAAGP